jgi:hypothetical protein
MRQGDDPHIIIANEGRILGIATGAGCSTEHECGKQKLQEALTSHVDELDDKLVEDLRAGKVVEFPKLIERKRISRNLENIKFYSIQCAEPEAYLGYSRDGFQPGDSQLALIHGDIAGAWDETSFGFRVRGEKNVKMLKELHEQILAKNVCFAGTFAECDGETRLNGIILMIVDRLRPEYVAEIAEVQKRYESKLRLKAASREVELQIKMQNCGVGNVGFIWPRWKDKSESEVVYCFNPDGNTKADYYGPYTFDEISDWIQMGCTYRLAPRKGRAAASVAPSP